ncbi:MAG: hypothetical protein K1X64_19545 [Myxococcaceae bacterium]|nr:hypothetical protein [Myxococcaceae bacterium]
MSASVFSRSAAWAALISVLLSSGCATLPKTGVPASGAPLAINTEEVWEWNFETRKVGEEYRASQDSSGDWTVRKTGDIHKTSLTGGDVTRWFALQDNLRIDDEDFFRITGQTGIADDVRDTRERALWWNRVGLGAAGLGVVLGVVGGLLARNLDSMGAGLTCLISGIILAPSGGYLALRSKFQVDHQLTSVDLAQAYAAQYNQTVHR